MGEALDVARRYYERFRVGDFDGATACFEPDCITVTPAGAMGTADHEQFGVPSRQPCPMPTWCLTGRSSPTIRWLSRVVS